MVAGTETSASTLTWMLYELAKNPSLQSAVREEIRLARESMRGEFTISDLDKMKLTLAVIKVCHHFNS